MNRPRVAVIMAVYGGDRAAFVREAIESLTAQSYDSSDVFVMQDGPVDEDLLATLDSITRQHANVRLFRAPARRGLAACLNDLIGRVRDEYAYVARMDADDVAEPDRLAKQVRFMEGHPDVDVLGGGIVDVDQDGHELKRVSYPLSHHEIRKLFRKRTPMAHVTVMYRPSYFVKAGLYPPVALEDGLYWMQGMSAGCRFHNLPDFLVRVRRTDDFLRRRSGWRKGWQELVVKVHINHRLRFGATAQLYALAMFGVQISPLFVKKVLYNVLR